MTPVGMAKQRNDIMILSEMKQRLLQLDTACVCDADKEEGLLRVVDPEIRPIPTGLKLVGRAHTVRCQEDFLSVLKALRDAEAGDVIVIDSKGSQKALTGELFPTEAKRKGLAGIVIDGACRDTVAIRQIGLPYYARSVNCAAGTTNRVFETQVTICCGGVVVRPGDILFGDDDGLIVGSLQDFAETIPTAEQIQAKEEKLLEGMRQGRSLFQMINFEEHCAQLEAGEESRLEFLV